MKWNWLHRVLLLPSVLILLNGCAFVEDIERTHKERMESYDAPEQLNGNPQNTGILLVDAITENVLNNLYLRGVAIANIREPEKPILFGSFKKGGFLSRLSGVVVIPNLQPGTYKIVKINTDNQELWETTYMPMTKEYEVTIIAGKPTYLGQIEVKHPLFSTREINVKYSKAREVESWGKVIDKYSESPWNEIIKEHIKGLQFAYPGASYAQQPAAPPPYRDASDYLNLDTGDHSISPHFSYVVEGGFFSGRRIVIYHVPDAQESKPREPLGTVGVDNYVIGEYERKSVYTVSDDGKILLYQHSLHPSTPGSLMAKPSGLYEYVHGKGDRMIHANTGIDNSIGRLPKDAIRFDMRSKDPLADPSETLVRTTGGEEYPATLVGGNALHRAVQFGEADKIKELMQSGLNVEAKNSRGFTPLHEAIWSAAARSRPLRLQRDHRPAARERRGHQHRKHYGQDTP